jgi:hypothetical protein
VWPDLIYSNRPSEQYDFPFWQIVLKKSKVLPQQIPAKADRFNARRTSGS